MDAEERRLHRRRHPQAAFLPVLVPAGLVEPFHRRVGHLAANRLIGRFQGRRRLLLQVRDRAQADRQFEDRFERRLDVAFAQAQHARLIQDHRRVFRAEDAGADARGDRMMRHRLAVGAGPRVTFELRHVDQPLRQFVRLVDRRRRVVRLRFDGQHMIATRTVRRHEWDRFGDVLLRQPLAEVRRVTPLTTGLLARWRPLGR